MSAAAATSMQFETKEILLETKVELDGLCGSKSAFIKRGSVLYRLKKRFQHQVTTNLDLSYPDRPQGSAFSSRISSSRISLIEGGSS
jgi:hypothetical protein